MPPSVPPDSADYRSLVAAQAATQQQLTAQTVALAATAAAGFTAWYDTAAVAQWAAGLAARIETVQRAMATSTDAYIARAVSMLTGSRPQAVGRVDVSALRDGISHADAYRRVGDVYRWQQHLFDEVARSLVDGNPKSPTIVAPAAAAVRRAKDVADMDAQLAFRAQSTATLQGSRAIGYRRVLHPELSAGGACGLCVAASDRKYHVAELMPVHKLCKCTVLPITEAGDPGAHMNAVDLGRLYDLAGGTGREKLKRVAYQVDEHGELGPVLNPKGAKVRTAREARKDTQTPHPKTDTERLAEVRRIRDKLAQALPKAHDLAGSDPKTWGEYLSKLEARVADLDHQLAA